MCVHPDPAASMSLEQRTHGHKPIASGHLGAEGMGMTASIGPPGVKIGLLPSGLGCRYVFFSHALYRPVVCR